MPCGTGLRAPRTTNPSEAGNHVSILRSFFELEANRIVLNFAHGLIFFLMGFGVLIKWKRWSELTLAKALPWLGAFGLLNALGDWGLVFLPIQTAVFSERMMSTLWVLDTALLSLSYACLLMFALKLLGETRPELGWLPRLAPVLYGIWFGALMFAWARSGLDWEADLKLTRDFEALYRYGFALTGSLLGAWALSLQKEELERLELHASIPPLMWVGFSLVLHAAAAGLVVPEASFFPANLLNDRAVFEATGLPVRLLTGVSGAIVAFFILDSLDVFDAEFQRRLETANRLHAVMGERLRIARDLHDGIIQTLYAVGLSLEGLILSLKDQGAEAEGEIRSIMRSVDGAIQDVRKYIVRLKAPDQEASLDEQLRVLVRDLQREARVPLRIKADPVEAGLVSAEAIMDVLLIVREAVSNAVRHARPSEIRITLVRDEQGINLSIVDDGIGFDPEARRAAAAGEHLGLDNMRRRADAIGGHLSVHSEKGHGTEILLRIPLKASGL